MAPFIAKRKPRAIRTRDDDDDEPDNVSGNGAAGTEPVKDVDIETTAVPLKFGRRSFKHSSLRKSINVDDTTREDTLHDDPAPKSLTPTTGDDDGDVSGPVVVRPALGRAGSIKTKKKRPSSRLSFGGDAAEAAGDGDDGSAFVTPKKSTLSARALENSNALRNRLPIGGSRASAEGNDDDDRPRYSKEFLDELANSTPNTPRDISSLRISSEHAHYDEAMELDLAELDGAVIVNQPGEMQALSEIKPAAPSILTETQIRERKERRARLAAEQEHMPLDDGSDNEDYISLGSRKKKEETRLVREDEDLGEGFEEYVDDGGLSLGRRAEREAAKRRRAEISELIDLAEGDHDGLGDADDPAQEDSDDSEAERRAAYEEAQTRAGMDGLRRHRNEEERGSRGTTAAEIPRMKTLPDLDECLGKMRTALQGMELDVAGKRRRVADLEREKAEIMAKEAEVQAILDKAGKEYQAKAGGVPDILSVNVAQSPMRPPLAGERGLESFGTTPRKGVDEVMEDGD